MSDYSEPATLHDILLSDSYVMNIVQSETAFRFRLIAALTPNHPKYSQPRPNEHHCYMDGNLVFKDARSVTWLKKTNVEYTDPEGDPDHGNIDSLIWSDGEYYVEGAWGQVSIETCRPPEFIAGE